MPALDEPGTRRFDALRPQRLAAPVTVYVEQHSAHPLEPDAAELYGPPDGYLDLDGEFHQSRRSMDAVPVYRITLHPDDGLYPLPYMARQRDGRAWETDAMDPQRPEDGTRQAFFPDASRLFEEIDRLLVLDDGDVNHLARLAQYDHYRVAPSAGWTRGRPDAGPTADQGQDGSAERLGEDFFPYRPKSMRREPLSRHLAGITNAVQAAIDTGRYEGVVWLEGSPFVEETSYWLNLLIDTDRPIAACAGSAGLLGAMNVIDSVRYITSRVWSDEHGNDRIGAVCVEDEQVFTAREVQKADDRPGGYTATGGHGGVVASMGRPGPPVLTFLPVRRHTATSGLNLRRLPREVLGLTWGGQGSVATAPVKVKERDGSLCADAIPSVRILKHARYLQREADHDATVDIELFARMRHDLERTSLVGFVAEGSTPYGDVTAPLDDALRRAILMGVPVVRVGRGDVGGFVPHERVAFGIAGGNLTATKARLLLMACLLSFGALPPARDPANPTDIEVREAIDALGRYQDAFDHH